MTTPELGKLEYVPVREIWADEARDFTPWLSQNLDRLGAEIGMELKLVRQEVTLPGGAGRVDILAKQIGSDADVVIENQLDVGDDGHCLRLLGYAANVGADILVWVASGFTEYHRSILAWLNKGDSIAVYAVEVSACRINESVAVQFCLVEGPEPQPTEGRATSASLSTNQRYALFYRPVVEQLRRAGIPTVSSGGWRGRWRSFPTEHKPHVYALALDDGQAWVFLSVRGENHQQVYDALGGHQPEIDDELDSAVIEWQQVERESWIAVKTDAALTDSEEHQEATRTWMVETLPKFKGVIDPYLNRVMAELEPRETADDDAPLQNDTEPTP